MSNAALQVVLQRCFHYEKSAICTMVDEVVRNLEFSHPLNGTVVLLKPNLISGRGASIACTHNQFIAGVAAWFLDQGATVRIGDSPAIGSTISVCERRGVVEATAGMDVKYVNFFTSVKKTLAGGATVNVAREALECDFFINLSKVKAHNQMFVTLATKNIFGIIKGINKALLHMSHGDSHHRFAGIILDLIELLPPALHLADGITAMHVSGPLAGRPLQLNCIGGATCPVGLDTALLELLELEKIKSPLWRVANDREYGGSDIDKIHFPLLSPADFSGSGFIAPEVLHPVRFNPFRFFNGMVKRALISIRQ